MQNITGEKQEKNLVRLNNRKDGSMLTEPEKYYAKLVISAADGSSEAKKIFLKDASYGVIPIEIIEYYTLYMDLSITGNSVEETRLDELCDKYETDEVLTYEVF